MDQKRAVTGRLAAKYRGCKSRKERGDILDQVMELNGYHRKYAAWLLRNYGKKRAVRVGANELVILVVGKKNTRRRTSRPRKYDKVVQEEVGFIWGVFKLCGKRMQPMMIDIIPTLIKRGRFRSGDQVHHKLLEVSAATIDRLLVGERAKCKPHGTTLTKPSSILKSHIPIVISSELDTEHPGHYQIDLVGHDGGNPNGHFARSLNAIELSSGWVEPRIVINEAQRWTKEALADIGAKAPIAIQSIHSDNDSAFINERLQRWCKEQEIRYTRARPYHSNDTCYIEQKNYDIVRQAVGYYRYETEEEIALIAELYDNLRPLVNFFLPSAKLLEKIRDGSRIKRRYDTPKSPVRRLLANPQVSKAVKVKLRVLKSRYDPIELKFNITRLQDQLIELQKRKAGAIAEPGPAYPQAREQMSARLFG